MSAQGADSQRRSWPPALLAVPLAIVLVFAVMRVRHDWPDIVAGRVPGDDFSERYVAHPWIAYLHIAPGVLYLVGAPLQLSRRFRTRHYAVHRRLGRVLATLGLVSGVLALALGTRFPWGGGLEASASAVFGAWFLLSLVLALRAIRRGDVRRHRRWMVRAFVVAVGVGTIRIWVGLFTALAFARSDVDPSVLPGHTGFGVAFWLGFAAHVALGEWWLRRTPPLDG